MSHHGHAHHHAHAKHKRHQHYDNAADMAMHRHGPFLPQDVKLMRHLARTILAEGLNADSAAALMDAAATHGITLHFDDGRERRDRKAAFTLHGYRIGGRFQSDDATLVAVDENARQRQFGTHDPALAMQQAERILFEKTRDGEGNALARASAEIQAIFPSNGAELMAQSERFRQAALRETAKAAVATQLTPVTYTPQPHTAPLPLQLANMENYYREQAQRQQRHHRG